MEMNWIAILASAVVTLLIGSVWYSPALFGKIWIRESGLNEEELKKGSMLKIFGLTFIFSILITMMINVFVVHQFGALGMVGGDATKALPSYQAFMADYGTAYRTFKHGALHGFMTGLLFVLPILAINGLFERKSWKYTLINGGYWIITLTALGAITCGWV